MTRHDPAAVCGGCAARWYGTRTCHCANCHTTFGSLALFDRHRSLTGEHGTCHSPAGLRTRDGDPVMFLRDGVWRGPEMDEATKLARFGDRGAA